MSEWSETFKNHPVHSLLETTIGQFETARRTPGERTIDITDGLDRLGRILRLAHTTLKEVEGDLAPIPALDAMVGYLNQIQPEMVAFQSSGGAASHVKNGNSHGTSLLSQLGSLRLFRKSTKAIDTKSFTEYRAEIRRLLESVEGKRAQLEAELGILQTKSVETTTEVNAQKARLDAAIAEFQSQFSTAEGQRLASAAEEVKERAAAFSEAIKSVNEASTATLTQQNQWFEEGRAALERESEEHLETLEALQAKAELLVGTIGNTGTVAGYKEVSDKAERRAFWWSIMAVGAMLGIIIFAVYAFWAVVGSDINLAAFSGRAFATLCIGILAAYAAQQSAIQDKQAQANRRTALELASLEPFLAGIDEMQLHDVKLKLVDRMFGQPRESDVKTTDKATTGTVKDFQKFAVEVVKAALEATKGK